MTFTATGRHYENITGTDLSQTHRLNLLPYLSGIISLKHWTQSFMDCLTKVVIIWTLSQFFHIIDKDFSIYFGWIVCVKSTVVQLLQLEHESLDKFVVFCSLQKIFLQDYSVFNSVHLCNLCWPTSLFLVKEIIITAWCCHHYASQWGWHIQVVVQC